MSRFRRFNLENINPNVRDIALMMADFGYTYGKEGGYTPPETVKKTFNLSDSDIYGDLIKPELLKIIPEDLRSIIEDKKKKTKKGKGGKGGKKGHQRMGGKAVSYTQLTLPTTPYV